jgi:hypothetical protein
MRLLALAGLLVIAAGCGNSFDINKPVDTREDALKAAAYAYDSAVGAGVNMRRSPCIFFNGGSWIVVVDVTGKRSFRDAVAPCEVGTEEVEEIAHAVVLDRDGKVLIAR